MPRDVDVKMFGHGFRKRHFATFLSQGEPAVSVFTSCLVVAKRPALHVLTERSLSCFIGSLVEAFERDFTNRIMTRFFIFRSDRLGIFIEILCFCRF